MFSNKREHTRTQKGRVFEVLLGKNNEVKFLSTPIILAPFTWAEKRSVILLFTGIQGDQMTRQYS
jgi:hypothetical protein